MVNFFKHVFAKANAEANPWQVGALEWTVSSPPPHHNFDKIPTVVRGPHEFAHPDVQRILGRDRISQIEELPGGSTEAAAPAASARRGV